MRCFLARSLVLLVLASSASARAPRQGDCAPEWQPAFGAFPGVDGEVNALVEFDDGSGPALYVGGDFDIAGASAAQGVARWGGSGWSALASGIAGTVRALAVFDDGSGPALFAAGNLTLAGGQEVGGIARWDGAAWSSVGTGLVTSGALAVFDDGSGPALYSGDVVPSRLKRWDGTSWLTVAELTGEVRALVVFDDGSGPALHVGGNFSSIGGIAASGIAKWDGTTWTSLGAGIGGAGVMCLAVHDVGDGPALYAGGSFATAGGVAASCVARWNGASWSSLGSGLAYPGSSAFVNALIGFDDGGGPTLIAGGSFTEAGGVTCSHLAAWDGAAWQPWGGTNDRVNALAVIDDGDGPELFAGGNFTRAGPVQLGCVARWSGAAWTSLGSGFATPIRALATFDAGGGAGPSLVAGGSFLRVGGVTAPRVASWDGATWSALGGGTGGPVEALAQFDDGSGPALYVGGTFVTPHQNLSRWDGASWSAVGGGPGVNGTVYALEVLDDGGGPVLLVGGRFTSAGGVAATNVARWDGASWSAMGSIGGEVRAFAQLDDGLGPQPSIYVAGNLWGGHLARWNGSWWVPVSPGLDGMVESLAVFDDGSGGGPALYVGGWFDHAGTLPTGGLAKWDGTSWSAVGGTSHVFSLETFDDGAGPALYVGGGFPSVGGGPANLARWNGSTWAALGGGVNGSVWAMAGFDDDDVAGPALYVGGLFTQAADSGDSMLARWQGCLDTAPPVLACPERVGKIEESGTPPGEIVHFSVSASDDRDPAPVVVAVPASGSFFPSGTTIVSCTATDAAGNVAHCEFPVVVQQRFRRR